MFNKNQKAKEESALMKYRFVNTRANDKSIMIVRNVLLPKLAHVVAGDIKVTLNPFKKTAQLYVGDVEDDTKVEKVEVEGETNVNIDLHIIYKISGEAYVEQYYNKKYVQKSNNTSNSDLLVELDTIKNMIISSNDGNLSRRSLLKIKEVLNIIMHRNLTDNELVDRLRAVKDIIANKISNPSAPLDLNIVDDVINDVKINFENAINSNNQDVHRDAVREFKELSKKNKIIEKKKWQYNHGAIKVYSILEKDPSFIVKVVESEVNAHVKTMCSKMYYDEVKNLKHINESIITEINKNLEQYGIEVSSVIVKSVDQANEELDKAGDRVKIAEREKEATIIKAKGEAEAIREKAEAEADAERKRQIAIADGIGAKARELASANLAESTKTALAGANVSTINLAGADSVLGAIASGFNQQHSVNPNANNFRETSSFEDNNTFKFLNTDDADENEVEENQTMPKEQPVEGNQNPVEQQQEVNQNPVEQQSTNNEAQDMEVADLYINLERLRRAQKRAIDELNVLNDKNSDEYKATQLDIADYGEQIEALEKKLRK